MAAGPSKEPREGGPNREGNGNGELSSGSGRNSKDEAKSKNETLQIVLPTDAYHYLVLHWGGKGGGVYQAWGLGSDAEGSATFEAPGKNALSFYSFYGPLARSSVRVPLPWSLNPPPCSCSVSPWRDSTGTRPGTGPRSNLSFGPVPVRLHRVKEPPKQDRTGPRAPPPHAGSQVGAREPAFGLSLRQAAKVRLEETVVSDRLTVWKRRQRPHIWKIYI